VRIVSRVAISILLLGLGAAGQARGMGTGLGGVPPLAGGLPGTGAPRLSGGFFPPARFARRHFGLGLGGFWGYAGLVEPYAEEGPQPQFIVIREEREQAPTPPAVVQPKLIEIPVSAQGKSKPEPTEPTVLVLRNGQQEEVKRYSVVGQFLYDYTNPPGPRRISLSDLDLEATERANSQHGVQFLLPASPSQVTVHF
jgi:hypothetical protein